VASSRDGRRNVAPWSESSREEYPTWSKSKKNIVTACSPSSGKRGPGPPSWASAGSSGGRSSSPLQLSFCGVSCMYEEFKKKKNIKGRVKEGRAT